MDALSGVRLRDRAAFFDGMLVVADLHIGRGASSNVELPVGDGADMADRFRELCRQFDPEVAVVAGDLLHSFRSVPGSIHETVDGIERAADEVDAAVVVTPGNHDNLLDAVWSGRIETEFRHGDTVVCHGHVEPEADAERYVVGHDHPTIEIEGKRHPCWLAGDAQYRDAAVLMLPSFNRLVPGVRINEMSTADFMSPLVGDADRLRPAVRDQDGEETLSFPPLGEFRHRL
jgi:putative SbcD/Mre11-related phosphoesterase